MRVQAAYEFAVNFGPTGSAGKWVGGDAHFGKTNAEYTYDNNSEFSIYGPDIIADGVDRNGMAQMGRNTVIEGNTISIRSNGFSDYNENNTKDANETDITWETEATASGLVSKTILSFNSNYTIAYSYTGMFKVNKAGYYDKCVVYPSEESFYIKDFSYPSIDGQNYLLDMPSAGCSVYVSSFGYAKDIYMVSSADKLYCRQNVNSFWGGANQVPGNVIAIGANYEIRKKDRSRLADLNYDSEVNFEDLGVFIEQWLSCGPEYSGNLNMNNPCVNLVDFAEFINDFNSSQ